MAFDFEKFPVYRLSLEYVREAEELLIQLDLPKNSRIADQLSRASLSISLNIAEGAGRYSKADKKHFYITARGSVFECVAILDVLLTKGKIDQSIHSKQYAILEELSKMLSGLINSQK
ncbi:MAG: four helix bundle protein [Candidatus Margulisbacteria bacterium]|nr:four helix bundle protein [Candidatus Margulisiibacteriota bacterium]